MQENTWIRTEGESGALTLTHRGGNDVRITSPLPEDVAMVHVKNPSAIDPGMTVVAVVDVAASQTAGVGVSTVSIRLRTVVTVVTADGPVTEPTTARTPGPRKKELVLRREHRDLARPAHFGREKRKQI